MNWLRKYILSQYISAENSPDENQLRYYYFGLFLLAGAVVSFLLLIYKEVFRSDLSNPVAETATILMFGSAIFFLHKNKKQMAVNMVFFIPLLVYLYYISGFSNSDSPSTTIYYLLFWYLSGLIVLSFMVPFEIRYILLYISGLISLTYHTISAGLSDQYLSLNQIFIYNPYIILTFLFAAIISLRIVFDKNLKRYYEQIRAAEQQNRDIAQQIRQPLAQLKVLSDQDGNIVRLEVEEINHAFESGFRMTLQEAKGQEVNYLFNYIFRNDTNWNDLFIIDRKQQTELFSPALGKWFFVHILWLNQETCFCFFNDISKEKEEIKLLQETKARYLTLLQAIPDIFFVIDRDGTFQDVVFKGQETMHPETAEVIGNTIFKAGFSEMMAGKIYQCIQKTIENDTIETIEYTMEVKGIILFFEMRLARLNENSVISIARDITRRKKAEFELEAARIRAEEANSLKSKFLANLSHDIRTPMNIIMGLTKLLADPTLSDFEKDEFIHDVQQQGFALLHIIDNTIQLSKIETNTLEVNPVYTNIHHLLRELFQHFYPLMPDHRDLQLKMQTMMQYDDVGFETDPYLLKESLFRLIDNAIKFTPCGTVTFGYTTVPGNSAEFFVADTGPGILPSEKDNIFLRFYVIEADRQAQKCGAGLGLPIAQHFVALLGGELQLDSNPGKGSRFWFRLPLKNPRGFMRIV